MFSQPQSTPGPGSTLPGSLYEGLPLLTPNTPPYRLPPPLSPPHASTLPVSDSDTDAPSPSSASDSLDDVSDTASEISEDIPYTSDSDFDEPPELPVLSHPPYRPPTDVRFCSRDALLANIQAFAKDNGFGVTIARSSTKRVGYQYMELKCIHGGRPGTHRKGYQEQRKRTVWAKQQHCPFHIYARNHGGVDIWGEPLPQDWRIDSETQCDRHNHPPSRPIDISVHRKASMTPEARAFLIGQIELRNKPRKIHANLVREFPSVLIARHDIYNTGHRHRWAERNGHTATEAIIRRLQDDGELARAFVDNRRRCVGLLYTTRQARALTHRFPTVLFVDTTFQTNRYKLPMLHLGGMTATGHTYTSAAILMLMQTTEWYELAIKAYLEFVQVPTDDIKVVLTDREPAIRNSLDKLLPHTYQILCMWHLSENIRGNTAKYFKRIAKRKPEYDWHEQSRLFRRSWIANVVDAKTKAAMLAGFDTIKAAFPEPGLRKAHAYLQGLQGHRKHFVAAYIDRYRHLGQRTTSRLEGTHKALKEHLDSHHDDLYELVRGLRSFLDDQWDARMLEFGKQREISDIGVGKMFLQVKGRVARKAIELVKKQLALAAKHIAAEARGDRPTPCTHHFTRSFGLPCSHDLKTFVLQRQPIPMKAFHTHWRLPVEQELRQWMEAAEDPATGFLQPPEITETVLPPSFTFPDDEDDQAIILDPPHRPRKRARRPRPDRRRPRPATQDDDGQAGGGGEGGGGGDGEQADPEPEQHPSGRWLGRHERQAGPLRPRQRKCSACGEKGHNRTSKDCPVRRQNRRQEVESARNESARNERRPLQESQAINHDRHTATFEQSAAETAGNTHSLPGTDAQSLSNVDSGSILGGSGHGQFDGLDQWAGGQEGNLLSDLELTADVMQLWEDIERVGNDVL